MTRLLIVSLNYAPEETGIGPYSAAVAEHLAATGYDVTVATGMPHYPEWRIASLYGDRASLDEARGGVRIRRRRNYIPRRQTAARRALYEASSLLMALDAARGPAPGAVIGVVPSLSGGIVARAAALRFGAPYGIICQDLVGRAAEGSGMPGGRLVAGVTRTAEGWALRGAAAVGIVAEGFRPYIESLGVSPTRIRRLRNWTRLAAPTVDRETARVRLGWPADAIVCLHAGNMGYKQALENIVECARMAAANGREYIFALMGDGNQRSVIEKLARAYTLPNLRIVPLQPADFYASALAAADVLLVNQRATVDDMSLPSKLASYAASGRPIVAAVPAASETARELLTNGAGIVAAPENPGALLDAIDRVARDHGLAGHLASNAQAWAEGALSADSALRGYEQFVAAVLAAGRSGRVHIPRIPAADGASANDEGYRWTP